MTEPAIKTGVMVSNPQNEMCMSHFTYQLQWFSYDSLVQRKRVYQMVHENNNKDT